MTQDLDQTALLVSAFMVSLFALPLAMAWIEQSPQKSRMCRSRAARRDTDRLRDPE